MSTIDPGGTVRTLFQAYTGQDLDIKSLSLEDAALVTLTNRTIALDKVLNGQLEDMNQRNKQIRELNKFAELLRASKDGGAIGEANKANYDAKGGWGGIWKTGKIENINGQNYAYQPDDLYTKAKDLGIDVSKYFEFKTEGTTTNNIKVGYWAIKSGTVDGREKKDGGESFADVLKTSIGDVIKDLTNEAQLDQIKLQSMMNKRGQVLELLSNLMSKFASTDDKIIGNTR